MKTANRPFRIGKKGNVLMWIVAGVGFVGSLLAFILSFIPPSQIQTGSSAVWFGVLFGGCIVVVIAPFIIYAYRKASWLSKDTQFEPFHWELANQTTTTTTNNPTGTTETVETTNK